MTKFFNWELYAGHALLAKTDQWNGCNLCNGSKVMNQSEMAFRELRANWYSELYSYNAGWHINVYNVCELASKRLRTDFYTFANWPETFVKRPLAKRPVGETTSYLFDQSLKMANSKSFKSLKISRLFSIDPCTCLAIYRYRRSKR